MRFWAQLKPRCTVIGTSKNTSKTTEMKSLEANEKFTLSKNAVAAALIIFVQKMSLAAVLSLKFSSSFDKHTP